MRRPSPWRRAPVPPPNRREKDLGSLRSRHVAAVLPAARIGFSPSRLNAA